MGMEWYIPVTSRFFPRCFYGSTENVSLLAVGTWFSVAALFRRGKPMSAASFLEFECAFYVQVKPRNLEDEREYWKLGEHTRNFEAVVWTGGQVLCPRQAHITNIPSLSWLCSCRTPVLCGGEEGMFSARRAMVSRGAAMRCCWLVRGYC